MKTSTRAEPWLPNFRRAVGYLRPHRTRLVLGLLSALGVSIFYTVSVSSIIPVLKILFAEHESIVDWLNRSEAEHRLGVSLPPDLPDDPQGLAILAVKPRSPNTDRLHAGDRLITLNGEALSSFDWAARLARAPAGELALVRLIGATGPAGAPEVRTLALAENNWWWGLAHRAALVLPFGRSVDDRYNALLAVMLGVVVVSTIGAAFRFANEGLVAIAVQRGMHDLRVHLADHILRLPLAWHVSQPPGDTLSRFATDIGKIEVGINTLFGKVVREPLKAIGVLTLAALLDPMMLAVGAIGLPLGVVAIRVFGRLVKKAQQRASASWGRLLDHLGERLHGIRVVKSFNMQAAESQRFAREGRNLARAQTHIELVDAASSPVLEVLASIAISAFALYGGSRVFSQELEPHILLGAIICLGAVFDPIRKMGNVYNRLQASEASGQRVFDVLDLPLEEDAGAIVGDSRRAAAPVAPLAPAPRRRLESALVFDDLSFAYPTAPQRQVLDRVSFRIDAGRMAALVGPNGCGKTTLVSLLLRFFKPDRGRILLDGVDIRELPLTTLRGMIGLVTQDAIVFSDSVRANIAYAPDPASDEQVQTAARRAHIDDFIDTLRTERNGRSAGGLMAPISAWTLSGGQRQRIALARAIVHDPAILVLDEATSQVDVESERKIQAALEDVARDRTTIVIAHRFTTVARADQIVALDQGRVVGVGGHDELLRTCPFYANLVQSQFHVDAAARAQP